MKVQCPECGADVEFRFDDSMVRVCKYCRAAVARTDRGVESLGKLADLVPMESAFKLFADGKYGTLSFTIVGKAQIQHSAGGLWQEWYARFGNGSWGWIAEHQGRVSVAFEQPDAKGAPHDRLKVGGKLTLGKSEFTVGEIGVAKYVAAEGELPYRLDPGAQFAFADLSDGLGGFATLDYGDPNRLAVEPSVYVGTWTTIGELGLRGGEEPTGASPSTKAKTLACPECGGNVPLRVPDQTLRVACPFCTQLISTENGVFELLGKLKTKPQLEIPLGTKVTLSQGEFIVVGYLKRSAFIDSTWYPFEEYLLHSATLGFRWLVCSDGHWSYVEPVDPGAVEILPTGERYRGVMFKSFQSCTLRVDEVWGELYWRVKTGDRSRTQDSIAPPAMLSRETEAREINVSLCSYLTIDEVRKATGQPIIDARVGVGPNQPPRFVGLGKLVWQLLLAVFVLGIGSCLTAGERTVQTFLLNVPPGKPPAPTEMPAGATPDDVPGNVFFSEPFDIQGGKNIDFSFSAPVDNNWMYIAVDLFDESTGAFVTIDKEIEYYHGVSGGESWSEGSRSGSTTIAPIKGGRYVARVEATHGAPTAMDARLTIRQDVFRGTWFATVLSLLGVLLITALVVRGKYEEKRMSNSGHYGPPADEKPKKGASHG